MESLSESNVLKFNPNTIYDVRKELNLHQDGVMEEIIRNFDEWIHKQPHFTKHNFSRHYLETSIINAKGSLERAKKILEKLCTSKTLLPEFFSKHDVTNDFADVNQYVIQVIVPKPMKDNYRVFIIKLTSSDFNPDWAMDFHRYTIMMGEYLKMHDYTLGVVVIVDCNDVNLSNFLPKINLMNLRNVASILMDSYGFRVKGIHVLSSSKAIGTLITLIKQVVSEKLSNRIKVHKTVDSLYEYIPREDLPEDYGGYQNSIKEIDENWKEALSAKENIAFFKEICQAGTNEKLRLTANYNEQILGMPGSFRTLTVD